MYKFYLTILKKIMVYNPINLVDTIRRHPIITSLTKINNLSLIRTPYLPLSQSHQLKIDSFRLFSIDDNRNSV